MLVTGKEVLLAYVIKVFATGGLGFYPLGGWGGLGLSW